GEVICSIAAMKLMTERTSEADGVITEILVENESVVEYGQPLFRIQQK
ncbi:acetyl-CoA carboxylase biotin carboxyl carrier protein, partial [Enterococcus gallinarum]